MSTNKPLLTIGVPAFNVEAYLEECLSSLICDSMDSLEIVIVDDGSTDNTAVIAKKFAKKYKQIRVISKLNGGHGSAINTALIEARGSYFKLLDGDDWLDSDGLDLLIKFLRKTSADIVLTDYTEFYLTSQKKNLIKNYRNMQAGTIYNTDDSVDNIFDQKGPLLSTTTFKTDLYKENPFFVDENCFYVDMEYNYFVYQLASSVTYVSIPLYVYRLEREGQSMQRSSLMKNYKDHEKVCLRLAAELEENKDTESQKYDYLISRIVAPICRSHYQILTEYLRSRSLFWAFDRNLRQYTTTYRSPLVSGKIITIHRVSRGMTVVLDKWLRKIGETFNSLEK